MRLVGASFRAARALLAPVHVQRYSSAAPQVSRLPRGDAARAIGAARPTRLAPKHVATVLRPYQEECVAICLEALRRGVSKLGVSSPTGSGKTTIFTDLLQRIEAAPGTAGRVLILVNSVALAFQAADTVQRLLPRLSVEIEQGARFVASGQADVTVATVQSLRVPERLLKYDPQQFKCVIVDEAHHATSVSYVKILKQFNTAIQMPAGRGVGPDATLEDMLLQQARVSDVRVPVIGFSATFSRHDGMALGNVFDEIVFHKDFLEMIDEEWLAPLRFTVVRAEFDLSQVASSGADYALASLARVVNRPDIIELVVRAWLERAYGERRSTLVFAVDILHVDALVEEFRRRNVDARALHSKIPLREREALLQEFRNGDFPVLVNCAILTEGADVPPIDCVLLARPTKSRNLFSQMIGRGMRQSPSTHKRDCLILDIVGNLAHGVVCVPTLFGLHDIKGLDDEMTTILERRRKKEDDAAAEDARRRERDNFWFRETPESVTFTDYDNPAAFMRAMRARKSGDVQNLSPNAWVQCGAHRFVLAAPDGSFVKVEADPQQKTKWHAVYSKRNPSHSWRDTAGQSVPFFRQRRILGSNELGHALRGCDTFLAKAVAAAGRSPMYLRSNAAWRQRPASSRTRTSIAKRISAQSDEDVNEQLANFTQGDADRLFTRSRHGAFSDYRRACRNRKNAAGGASKARRRKASESVRVGPLPK